jgi:hypothetical protein
MLASTVVFWVFVGTGYTLWDPDIWWHLRDAEYLFTNLSTPHVDLFSYTVGGHPWMNHEWLAEVPYYLAWRGGGLLGIFGLYFALLAAIHLGIFYLAYKQSANLKAAFLVACFSVLLVRVTFGPRMILWGYVYLVIVLIILSRYRATGQSPLWAIPLVFCVWVNSHGSWLLGMIVFGLFVAGGLVGGSWGRVDAVRWTPQQLKRLLLTAGASFAALFVNPFSYRLVFYPFDLAFRQKLNVAVVDEWSSVDFHDARGKVVLVLLAAVFLGALLSRHRWKLEELLLAGFAIYSGLTHIRFLALAAILLAPLLAKMLDAVPPYRPEIDKPLLNAVVMAILLIYVIRRFPSPQDLDKAVAERFPINAVAFMKSHGMPGNIFNRYMWGGYMIMFCPEVKVFIDSRTDIFDYKGVLRDYVDAEQLRGSLEILDKYQVRYVLLPPNYPLAYLLKNHVGWKTIFADERATIFERVSAQPVSSSTSSSPGGSE